MSNKGFKFPNIEVRGSGDGLASNSTNLKDSRWPFWHGPAQ